MVKTLAFFIIILAAAVLCAGALRGDLPLQEDSCIYLNLAQSMAKGLGYTYTVEPLDRPANYHPPGYPVMLVPLVSFFPGNYAVPRMLNIVLALIFLVVFFYSFGSVFKDEGDISVIALLGFNCFFIFYWRQALTEMPYLLFSFLSVYFLQVSRRIFVPALAMALAFYTRSIGITLAIAAGIYLLSQRRFKSGLFLGAWFIILVSPWLYYSSKVGKNAYIAEFGGATPGIVKLIGRGFYNLAATVGKELPDLFFYPFFSSVDPRSFIFIFKFLLGSAIVFLLFSGFLKKIKEKGFRFFDLYALVYLCFYLSWTHHGARYLVPILPFLSYYLFFGIKTLIRRESVSRAVVYLIVAFNIAGCVKEIVRERNSPYLPEERSFISAVDWLKRNAPSKSIILSRRNNFVYIYTQGLRGLKLLRDKDATKQYGYIMDNKVDYVVIDQNKIYRDDARDYLLPLVRDYPDTFEMVYLSPEKPQTWVYKVKRGI